MPESSASLHAQVLFDAASRDDQGHALNLFLLALTADQRRTALAEVVDTKRKWNSLHCIGVHGQRPALQLVLRALTPPATQPSAAAELGRLLNAVDRNGNTPLHLACAHHPKLALDLLAWKFHDEASLHVDLPNLKGWSPLHLAAYNNFHAVVEALLQRGAAPLAVAGQPRPEPAGLCGTPLVLAAAGYGDALLLKRLEQAEDALVSQLAGSPSLCPEQLTLYYPHWRRHAFLMACENRNRSAVNHFLASGRFTRQHLQDALAVACVWEDTALAAGLVASGCDPWPVLLFCRRTDGFGRPIGPRKWL